MGVPQSPNPPGGQPQQPYSGAQQAPGQPSVQGAPPFPQQPQPPQQWQQPQYSYPGPPPVQPGPQPVQPPAAPDWQQLADQREAQARRKRTLLVVGIGAGVLLLAAGGISVALLNKDDKTPDPVASASQSAPATGSPKASGSPKPSGSASPAKPLPPAVTSDVLFADQSLNIGGHNYVRKTIANTDTCWKATGGGLGDVLSGANCNRLMRATYFTGNTAVTVGVAVFKDEADAKKAGSGVKGQIQPLFGQDDVAVFCRDVSCALTNRVEGRYLVFTVAGPIGGAAGDQDQVAQSSGKELDGYFDQLLTKGA
ncbi:hypothetical protein HUT16_13625 [Kitasatospora sp. NA04385]|uniref:hypothetical protein n=1 Tax=Kitasatospora sp. NA04385 TaxID=2742135 RepID=UPI0015909E2B|nr:hypothetical protein [Kitasatospora sp. NA04385]QKW19963.1 hypothetical protein HUT16_13625 [Kitasatospora sp. NA04385]